jgi:hypothetical protein
MSASRTTTPRMIAESGTEFPSKQKAPISRSCAILDAISSLPFANVLREHPQGLASHTTSINQFRCRGEMTSTEAFEGNNTLSGRPGGGSVLLDLTHHFEVMSE